MRVFSRPIPLILCCFLTALSSLKLARADECLIDRSPNSTKIGLHCTKDPSCIVVGETHMLEWKSASPGKIVVVCVHGLGLCARAYKPLAKELSTSGIDGYAVNVRGFGPDRDKPERAKLDCNETVDDIRELLSGIRKNYSDSKVFLLGESMGGALAIRIAAENPDLIDGVVCSAPAWKLLRIHRTAIKGVVELVFFPRSHIGPAGRAIVNQATTDANLAEHWLSDPSHKLKLSLGEARSFMRFISKTDNYAKQLKMPVLMIQGLNDQLVSPKAVAQLFNRIPSEEKTFFIDGQGEHIVLEEGKFSSQLKEKLIKWMINEFNSKTAQASIEVVNDQELSSKQKRLLHVLQQSGH